MTSPELEMPAAWVQRIEDEESDTFEEEPLDAKRLGMGLPQVSSLKHVQMNIGRTQQQGRQNLEPLFRSRNKGIVFAAALGAATKQEVVLEAFEGFVDDVMNSVAYVTLTSPSGEEYLAEYPSAELSELGIHEHRRFICQTVVDNNQVIVRLKPVPDLEWTKEEDLALKRKLDELVSGGELDGDY